MYPQPPNSPSQPGQPFQSYPEQPYPGQQPPPYPQQPYQQPYAGPPNFQPTPPPKKKRRIWLWVIVGIIVFAVIGSVANAGKGNSDTGSSANTTTTQAATTAATSAPTPTATPKPLKWTTVQTFTGSGNKKTATFSVPGDWKILWSCPSADVAAQFGQYNLAVDVNNSDGTPADPGAINELCKSGNLSGETEERVSGQVYLDIQSEAGWTIKIQELK